MKKSVKLKAMVNIFMDNGEIYDVEMHEWEFDHFMKELNEKRFGLLLDEEIYLNAKKIIKVVFDWRVADEGEE